MRNLGQRAKGEHVVVGFNERLDGLQAAALRIKLTRLDQWNEARRERAAWYADGLGGAVPTLEVRDPSACVYHLFPVKVPDRDGLKAALAESGVEAAIHYSPPVHEHPALAGVVRQPHELVNASLWARQELSLPMYPTLSKTDVEHIVELCCAYAGHSRRRENDHKKWA